MEDMENFGKFLKDFVERHKNHNTEDFNINLVSRRTFKIKQDLNRIGKNY
jgi:hypothetical protein